MNIGFVGVGRMGANMARRLKDRDVHVTAVYDTNRKVATTLAAELGCAACQKEEPILKELGSTVRFVGQSGEAAKVKALVNMVMNINTAGLAEGLGLGAALGLDLEMLRKIFSQTGAASRVLETDGEDMQNREHACFFSAAHAAKDNGIALELARSLSLDLPLARATKEQYDRMIAEGLGELDKSGIAELTFKDRHKHSGDHV